MAFLSMQIRLSELDSELAEQQQKGFRLLFSFPTTSSISELEPNAASLFCLFTDDPITNGGFSVATTRLVKFERAGKAVWVDPIDVIAIREETASRSRILLTGGDSVVIDENADIAAEALADETTDAT